MTTTDAAPTAWVSRCPVCDVRIVADDGATGARCAARRCRRDLDPRPERRARVLAPRGARPPPRSPTAGCTRATSAASTTRDSSTSSTGPRTSSSAAARTSPASRSRPRSTSTRRSPRRPSSRHPHPTLGEEVAAVVRLWPGTAARPTRSCGPTSRNGSRRSRCRRSVWFVGEPFPRNAAGKVLKRELQGPLRTGVQFRLTRHSVTRVRTNRVTGRGRGCVG